DPGRDRFRVAFQDVQAVPGEGFLELEAAAFDVPAVVTRLRFLHAGVVQPGEHLPVLEYVRQLLPYPGNPLSEFVAAALAQPALDARQQLLRLVPAAFRAGAVQAGQVVLAGARQLRFLEQALGFPAGLLGFSLRLQARQLSLAFDFLPRQLGRSL